MNGLEAAVGSTKQVGIMQAFRQVTRQPSARHAPAPGCHPCMSRPRQHVAGAATGCSLVGMAHGVKDCFDVFGALLEAPVDDLIFLSPGGWTNVTCVIYGVLAAGKPALSI